MGRNPDEQAADAASPDETTVDPAAETDDFEFDENAAEEIERAIDDSEGHENERGLTNWHVS